VISPLLANIYLHYAFDLWVNVWRKKWAHGEVVVIRYADDTILGFQHQADADRFLENLRERLGKFGLELHPEKTRRIEFGRFAEENRRRRGEDKPETFDFLGFQHISGKNGIGRFTVRRTTIRKRMRADCDRSSRSSTGACTIPCSKLANGSNRSCRATSTTMRCQETSKASRCSGTDCWDCGGAHFAAGANSIDSPGPARLRWANDGFLNRECSIPIPLIASPPVIRDKNRMR